MTMSMTRIAMTMIMTMNDYMDSDGLDSVMFIILIKSRDYNYNDLLSW